VIIRRSFVGSLAPAVGVPRQEEAVVAAKRPGIPFFMADQLRKDCLGCFGNRVIRTPNFHGGHEWGQMYDLKNDPDEFVNLWFVNLWNDAGYRARRLERTALLVEALLGALEPVGARTFDY
jgi:hypothetical protein